MSPFEWIAIAYFGGVTAVSWRPGVGPRGALEAAGAIALVIVARFTLPWEVRAWMPLGYLAVGYWIPATFTPAPRDDRFERWLVRADARLISRRRARGSPSPRLPGPVPDGAAVGVSGARATLLEAAYLLCYPLVPAACAVVFVAGDRVDVTRFWVAVLLAGYACYGSLRWTAARPPRLATPHLPTGLASVNAALLGRASHQLNTFPSGHAAVSLAAALSVARVSPMAGAAFGLVAAGIAAAAVTGRYHYLVDVLFGVFVGFVAAAVATAIV